MQNSQHTQGEWETDGEFVFVRDSKLSSFKHNICFLRTAEIESKRSNKEIEANARLIAAAPKLLEALIFIRKELIQHTHGAVPGNPVFYAIDRAEAAIAKAKGTV